MRDALDVIFTLIGCLIIIGVIGALSFGLEMLKWHLIIGSVLVK